MFSENNLSKDYFNISKYELRLRVCHNERDLDESLLSIAEYAIYYINRKRSTTLPPLVNISRIKKFKDLCDEDIVGIRFSIINSIKRIHLLFEKLQFVLNALHTYLNILKYSLPIFIILGFLGNCLSAIVLLRKKMRSFSSNIYLSVLAICDTVYSMRILIYWLDIMNILPKNNSYWSNFLVDFLSCFSKFLSVWLIVAFTIERYIITKYPLLRRSWCTVKRAKIVVITLMGLAILYSISQTFIFYRTAKYVLMIKKEINVYDVYKQLEFDHQKGTTQIMRIIESIILFTLPALVIIICNILIICHISQQNRVRKTLITASDSCKGRIQICSDKMLQHKITKMLILISSIFVILKLPQYYNIYPFSNIRKYFNFGVMTAIFVLLDRAHYCINFVLYCATGQTFRKKLIRMFSKRTSIRRNRNIIEIDNYK